jgi:hypothetical protein
MIYMNIMQLPDDIKLMIVKHLPIINIYNICSINEEFKVFIIDNDEAILKNFIKFFENYPINKSINNMIFHLYKKYQKYNKSANQILGLLFKTIKYMLHEDFKPSGDFIKTVSVQSHMEDIRLFNTAPNIYKYLNLRFIYNLTHFDAMFIVVKNIDIETINKIAPYLLRGYNFHEIFDCMEENITDEQFKLILRILDACPQVNNKKSNSIYSQFDDDYSLYDIVNHMNNPSDVDKIIKYINEDFERVDIFNIINASDNKIAIMYTLISQGIEKDIAADVISALNDEDMLTYLSFINDYNINQEDLSYIIHNHLDGMLQRIKILVKHGIDFMSAHHMVDENKDTIENIQQIVNLMSNGMNSHDAYEQFLSNHDD